MARAGGAARGSSGRARPPAPGRPGSRPRDLPAVRPGARGRPRPASSTRRRHRWLAVAVRSISFDHPEVEPEPRRRSAADRRYSARRRRRGPPRTRPRSSRSGEGAGRGSLRSRRAERRRAAQTGSTPTAAAQRRTAAELLGPLPERRDSGRELGEVDTGLHDVEHAPPGLDRVGGLPGHPGGAPPWWRWPRRRARRGRRAPPRGASRADRAPGAPRRLPSAVRAGRAAPVPPGEQGIDQHVRRPDQPGGAADGIEHRGVSTKLPSCRPLAVTRPTSSARKRSAAATTAAPACNESRRATISAPSRRRRQPLLRRAEETGEPFGEASHLARRERLVARRRALDPHRQHVASAGVRGGAIGRGGEAVEARGVRTPEGGPADRHLLPPARAGCGLLRRCQAGEGRVDLRDLRRDRRELLAVAAGGAVPAARADGAGELGAPGRREEVAEEPELPSEGGGVRPPPARAGRAPARGVDAPGPPGRGDDRVQHRAHPPRPRRARLPVPWGRCRRRRRPRSRRRTPLQRAGPRRGGVARTPPETPPTPAAPAPRPPAGTVSPLPVPGRRRDRGRSRPAHPGQWLPAHHRAVRADLELPGDDEPLRRGEPGHVALAGLERGDADPDGHPAAWREAAGRGGCKEVLPDLVPGPLEDAASRPSSCA